MNNIVISEVTESEYLKMKNDFPSNFFGDRKLVTWKTYFECFGKKYQLGTQVWWEYLKTVLQKKFPMESYFLDKNFWRILLSVGLQKPEDRKEKIPLGPFFIRESLSKMKIFFWKVWYYLSMGPKGFRITIKLLFLGKPVFMKNFFHGQLFWTT